MSRKFNLRDFGKKKVLFEGKNKKHILSLADNGKLVAKVYRLENGYEWYFEDMYTPFSQKVPATI